MLVLRVLVLGAALLLLPDCSNVTRVSAGPVAAYPGKGHVSYGEQLSVRRGIGTSDFASGDVMGYEGRLLVTEETQALSLGVHYEAFRWAGPVLTFFDLAPALGFELTREKPLGNAGLHGALGFGWTFEEERSQRRARWALIPEVCGIDCDREVTIERRRRVVTLELTGSADLRGTRQPLYAYGLLLGVAFTDEQDDVRLPPRDPLDGFGWGPRDRRGWGPRPLLGPPPIRR